MGAEVPMTGSEVVGTDGGAASSPSVSTGAAAVTGSAFSACPNVVSLAMLNR